MLNAMKVLTRDICPIISATGGGEALIGACTACTEAVV